MWKFKLSWQTVICKFIFLGLELTSYIQAADDSNCTDSPAWHSALSEIVSLVKYCDCRNKILVIIVNWVVKGMCCHHIVPAWWCYSQIASCLFSAGSIQGIQDFSSLKYMQDSWDVQFHPQERDLWPSRFIHFTPLPSQCRKLMLSMWWISTSGILQVVLSILKLELATYVHLVFPSIGI